MQTSISVIGASGGVSQAVGQPADQVRQKVDVSNRWIAVEDELRVMLSSISDANLKRRQEIALLSAQAYTIGTSLARNPENGALKPHLKEIKRLRNRAGRKKAASAPETPALEMPAPSVPSSTPSSTPVAPSAPAAASAKPQS